MTKQLRQGFTLSELVIGLCIIGVLAVLVLPTVLNSSPSKKNTQIAESLKTDINKAFELQVAQGGLVQKSDSPTSIIQNALEYQQTNDSVSQASYKTPSNFTITVPKTWTTSQATGKDSAVITVTAPDGTTSTVTEYRDNTAANQTALAETVQPIVAHDNGGSTTSSSASHTPPSAVTVTPPASPTFYTAMIKVTDIRNGVLLPNARIISTGNSACGSGPTVLGQIGYNMIPKGASCTYTATATGYINNSVSVVMNADKTLTIALNPQPYTVTINVTGGPSTGAIITPKNDNNYSNCAGSGGTWSNATTYVIRNVFYGSQCHYLPSATGYDGTQTNSMVINNNTAFTAVMAIKRFNVSIAVNRNGLDYGGLDAIANGTNCAGVGSNWTGNVKTYYAVPYGSVCSYTGKAIGYNTVNTETKTITQNTTYTSNISINRYNVSITVNRNGGDFSGLDAVPNGANCGGVGSNWSGNTKTYYGVPYGSVCYYTGKATGYNSVNTDTKTIYNNANYSTSLSINLYDVSIAVNRNGGDFSGLDAVANGGNCAGAYSYWNASTKIYHAVPYGSVCYYTGKANGYNSVNTETKTITGNTGFTSNLSINRYEVSITLNRNAQDFGGGDAVPNGNGCGGNGSGWNGNTKVYHNVPYGSVCYYMGKSTGYDNNYTDTKTITGDTNYQLALALQHFTTTISIAGGATYPNIIPNGNGCGGWSGSWTANGTVAVYNGVPYGTTCSYSTSANSYTNGNSEWKTIYGSTSFNINMTKLNRVIINLDYEANQLRDSNGWPMNLQTTETIDIFDAWGNKIDSQVRQIGGSTDVIFSNKPAGHYWYNLYSNNNDTISRYSNQFDIGNGDYWTHQTLNVANVFVALDYAPDHYIAGSKDYTNWNSSIDPWLAWFNSFGANVTAATFGQYFDGAMNSDSFLIKTGLAPFFGNGAMVGIQTGNLNNGGGYSSNMGLLYSYYTSQFAQYIPNFVGQSFETTVANNGIQAFVNADGSYSGASGVDNYIGYSFSTGNVMEPGKLTNTYIYDPNTHTVYKNEAYWFSPIKIALDSLNAKLNSTDAFKLALGGAKIAPKMVVQTSGGLNTNEAWLFMDRGAPGIWTNNTIDNDDLFGDHTGRFKNGYDELRVVFAKQLQYDSKGNAYIPFDNSFMHQTWVSITRLFGDKTPDAAHDLKLFTRDRKILSAADYMQRMYVNNWNTMEYDKQQENAIFQRAWVQTKSGKFAQSADQWFRFRSKKITVASPAETAAVKKQLGVK